MLPLHLPLCLNANVSHPHSISEIPDYHPSQPPPQLHKRWHLRKAHTTIGWGSGGLLWKGNDNICSKTCEFMKKPHFKMSEFLALCQYLLGTNNIGPYWHTLVGFPINERHCSHSQVSCTKSLKSSNSNFKVWQRVMWSEGMLGKYMIKQQLSPLREWLKQS